MKIYPDLGPYCTYAQATYSNKAIRLGLENTPNQEQFENMVRVYENVIHPVADWLGMAPGINSFFRSAVLKKVGGVWVSVNSAIGGSATSDHPNGRAVDLSLRLIKTPKTNIDLGKFVKDHIDFDQMILDNVDPDTKRPAWIHVGFRGTKGNRREIIEAIFKDGKAEYSFLK